MWIKGDLHVHSNCCHDGTLPVAEIVERAREYCDFTAISGHCRKVEFPRIKQQYAEVLKALQKFDIPIFCTAETEFPVPRHMMFVTTPEDRALELQRMVCERFCRYEGNEGIEKAITVTSFRLFGFASSSPRYQHFTELV